MKTIDIAQILSPDLKSRMRAQDLKLFIENSGASFIGLDFSNVRFATRSFIDEFFNLFLRDSSSNKFKVEILNLPEDLKVMLDAVSKTQVKATTIASNIPEKSFVDVEDLLQYLSASTS